MWCGRARNGPTCYHSASGHSARDGHEAAIDLRAVPGIGAEIVLTVDGELRRTRLYRAHEQAELSAAIADTRVTPSRRRDGHETWNETERAELIAGLHQAATFAEAVLNLNERLLDALATGENRPSVDEIAFLRAGLSRWLEQLATLRQRIAGLTVAPPERMQ